VKTKLPKSKEVPLEYACLFLPHSAAANDNRYSFTAINEYAGTAFYSGIEKDNSAKSLLKRLKQLMVHIEFVKPKNKPFKIILHKYQEAEKQINKIIASYNGVVVFDETHVIKVAVAFGESLFKQMPKFKGGGTQVV
jgi:hypothetical protein